MSHAPVVEVAQTKSLLVVLSVCAINIVRAHTVYNTFPRSPVDPVVVVHGDVRMLFPRLASVGIVAHIVRVLDVICTAGKPNSFVHPRVAHNAPVPAVSLACSQQCIHPQCAPRGHRSVRVAPQSGTTSRVVSCNERVLLSALLVFERFIALFPDALSKRALTAWGLEPSERRTRDLISSLNVTSFNARQLWSRDGSAHSGLHLLAEILHSDDVDVLRIQEGNAGEFQSFFMDQTFSSEGIWPGCRVPRP